MTLTDLQKRCAGLSASAELLICLVVLRGVHAKQQICRSRPLWMSQSTY